MAAQAPIVIAIGFETGNAREAAQQLARELQTVLDGIANQSRQAGRNIDDAISRPLREAVKKLGNELSGLGQKLSISLTLPLSGLGVAALKAAADLDKSRQTLTALTGSVDAANRKLAELRQLAQSAPGVTTSFASELFAQFKALGTIADSSINNVIRSLGRLNAVFSLPDPSQFARNLQQIFTQGFERADIKEALGQVPIFEQLLEQAFGTRDAAKLRQLKEAGKLTAESYFQGISTAINTRFPQVQESILARFQKTKDQLLVSLVPLGEAIITTLQPIIERIIPQIQALLAEFAKLPPSTQEWIVKLGLLAVALGPVLAALGSFLTILTSIGGLIGALGGGGLIGALAVLNPATVALGVAAAGAAIGYFSLQRAIKSVSDQADQALRKQREASGEFENLAGQQITRRGGRFIDAQQVRAGQAAATAAGGALQTSGVNLLTGEPIRPETARPAAAATPASVEAIKRAVEEARKMKESLLRLEQERVEQTARLLNAETDTRARALKAQFAAGLIEYQAYYAQLQGLEERRTAIQAETTAAQVELIKREIGQLEQARSASRGAERVDIERQLLQLYTEQRLKVDELTEALNQNTQAAINRVRTTVQLAGGDIRGPQLSAIETPVAPGASPQQIAEAGLLDLRRQQVAVENQIEQGILNQADGRRQINEILRQERDLRQATLLAELKQIDLAPEIRAQKQLELESIRNLGVELTAAQRFMRGFGSEVDSVGDAFERLGQNLSRSFANVKGLLGNLKQSITQFFRDLLGQGIQRVFQQIFGSITNAIFGGVSSSAARSSGGGGAGGTLAGIAGSAISGAFGGGGGGFGGIFGGGGGGGFLTPGFGGGFPSIGGFTGPSSAGPPSGGPVSGQFGGLAGLASLFRGPGSLFRGFGFGRAAGSARGPLAAIAPLLGAQLGAGLGGRSRLGQILGGVGGAALGIGLTAAPAALLAGGSLAAFGGLAALFSNPITAGVGAALLVGSLLLGRSQQRRNDEQQSGVFLQEAVSQIGQLRDQVRSGQLPLSQARQIFESQILATFISNIQTLKTKSVRESRLTNQVRDLRNLFDSTVASQASTGAKVNAVNDRLIPEFAMGGIVPGIDRGFDSVMARVRPGEMVLTRGQQSAIQGIAGPGVFRAAGVPEAAQMTARGPLFANGGMLRTLSQPALVNTPYAALTGRGGDQPVTMDVTMNLVVGREDASRLVVSGQTTSAGQRAVVGIVRKAILEREF